MIHVPIQPGINISSCFFLHFWHGDSRKSQDLAWAACSVPRTRRSIAMSILRIHDQAILSACISRDLKNIIETVSRLQALRSEPGIDCSEREFSRFSFRSRTGGRTGVAPVRTASERDPRSTSRSRCSLRNNRAAVGATERLEGCAVGHGAWSPAARRPAVPGENCHGRPIPKEVLFLCTLGEWQVALVFSSWAAAHSNRWHSIAGGRVGRWCAWEGVGGACPGVLLRARQTPLSTAQPTRRPTVLMKQPACRHEAAACTECHC